MQELVSHGAIIGAAPWAQMRDWLRSVVGLRFISLFLGA